MHLLSVSFNHRVTPLSIREAVALDRLAAAALATSLKAQDVIDECLVLATCNRTEIYCVGPCTEGIKEAVIQAICKKTGLSGKELANNSEAFEGAGMVKHLFRVAASLDAMVIGESQVLGQLKTAYQAASEHSTIGPYLHKICHAAFAAAKKARSETQIAALPVSIGTIATRLLKETIGELTDKNILILGAGEMGKIVSEHLCENGATHLWIANRTLSASQALAKEVNGITLSFASWKSHLKTADVLITSVSGGIQIGPRDLAGRAAQNERRPLTIMDLGIPRNVSELVLDTPQVRLFNIDNLKGTAAKNLSLRKEEACKAEQIVAHTSAEAFKELSTIELAPLLAELNKRHRAVLEAELEKLFAKLKFLTDTEKWEIRLCAESVIKKMLHEPIRRAKEELARPGADGKAVAAELKNAFQLGGAL